MTDANYELMLTRMEQIAEALEQARKEADPGRRRKILEAAAYDAERSLQIRGLDRTSIDWFTRKWVEASEGAGV